MKRSSLVWRDRSLKANQLLPVNGRSGMEPFGRSREPGIPSSLLKDGRHGFFRPWRASFFAFKRKNEKTPFC